MQRIADNLSEEVAGHYDHLDAFYREVWGEHLHHGYWETGRETAEEAVVRLLERVADAAGIEPGMRVCDIGCGYAAGADFLQRTRDVAVTGYTLSERQYDIGRDRNNPRLTVKLCDWLQNDEAADSFDAAVAIECLSHIADKTAFFRELRRVLKPGRRATLCVWLQGDRLGRFREGQVRAITREGRLGGMPTEEECRELIRGAGFSLVSFEDATARVRRTWSIVIQRVLKGLLTRRDYRRFLMNGPTEDRVFALTTLRIWLAMHTGGMRYGMFAVQAE